GQFSFQFLDPLVLSVERLERGCHTDGQDDACQPEIRRPVGLLDRRTTQEQETTHPQNENRGQQESSSPHSNPPRCALPRRRSKFSRRAGRRDTIPRNAAMPARAAVIAGSAYLLASTWIVTSAADGSARNLRSPPSTDPHSRRQNEARPVEPICEFNRLP